MTSTAALPTQMPAAVLLGPCLFEIVHKPLAEVGSSDVLVRVAMCGTCGTDLVLQDHPLAGQRYPLDDIQQGVRGSARAPR